MELFREYQLSNRSAMSGYILARRIGLLPIFVSLVLMLAWPDGPGPGLWCSLGLSLGLELVLWGSYELYITKEDISPIGAFLVKHANEWFPILLFFVKYAFMMITLSILWFTLTDLGFPSAQWQHALFYLLIGIIPSDRFFQEAALRIQTSRMTIISAFFHSLKISLITVIAGTTLLSSIESASAPYGTMTIPYHLIIWVIMILIILSQITLFMGQLARIRQHTDV